MSVEIFAGRVSCSLFAQLPRTECCGWLDVLVPPDTTFDTQEPNAIIACDTGRPPPPMSRSVSIRFKWGSIDPASPMIVGCYSAHE